MLRGLLTGCSWSGWWASPLSVSLAASAKPSGQRPEASHPGSVRLVPHQSLSYRFRVMGVMLQQSSTLTPTLHIAWLHTLEELGAWAMLPGWVPWRTRAAAWGSATALSFFVSASLSVSVPCSLRRAAVCLTTSGPVCCTSGSQGPQQVRVTGSEQLECSNSQWTQTLRDTYKEHRK